MSNMDLDCGSITEKEELIQSIRVSVNQSQITLAINYTLKDLTET